jgi:hypothetical protein
MVAISTAASDSVESRVLWFDEQLKQAAMFSPDQFSAASEPTTAPVQQPSPAATGSTTQDKNLFRRGSEELSIATRVLEAITDRPLTRAGWSFLNQVRLAMDEVQRQQEHAEPAAITQLLYERLSMARTTALEAAEDAEAWFQIARAIQPDAEMLSVPARFVKQEPTTVGEAFDVPGLCAQRKRRSWFSDD